MQKTISLFLSIKLLLHVITTWFMLIMFYIKWIFVVNVAVLCHNKQTSNADHLGFFSHLLLFFFNRKIVFSLKPSTGYNFHI